MRMKKILCIFLLLALLSSCEGWLNVKPKTETDSNDLFNTEDGFKNALAGVYTMMTDETLYGRELTFGLVGVLGMEWDVNAGQLALSTNPYYYAKSYDYTNANVKAKINNIWSNQYNAIANVNKLLEYTEKNKPVLKGINHDIIKGEALALRAYLHFDILRLFASSDFNSQQKYIPYVETSLAQISVLRTNADVAAHIIADLKNAENLLKVDPVYTGEDYSNKDNGYLANRNFHLNYWAVRALKARAYLYENKKDSALIEAKAVIAAQASGLFPWVKIDDITNTNVNLRDRTFSTEHLFALNNTRMKDQISGYFSDTTTPFLTRLSVETFGNTSSLFSQQADYRYFFEESNGVINVLSKFWQMDASNGITPKKSRMPLIRISEMYYIAAESIASDDLPGAVGYLNEVRRRRGLSGSLPTSTTYADFMNELLAEYQREFIGEGQVFFYHKRQHTSVIYNAVANYIFPLPDSEIDYRQ